MLLVPAALAEVPVDGGGEAGGFALNRAGTNVSALSIILIGHDVVVLHRVEDHGPVEGGEVAEVGVLLHPHGPTGDIHQTVKSDLLQLQHLKQHERIVEEEIIASHHREVGKQVAEGLQAIDTEQEQVVRHYCQLGVTQAAEILRFGREHEQDL